ncbi:hypothetical protein EQK42_16500 [Streptomyces albidoflavus]|uniref:hypothetical protein n=1 Tax=Streptomyces albidoflavus TaxID=1886 RepID=UPI000FEE8FFE|nr:hypothetical protein [Streptomyces albidoflavus]RWZ74906.1 hypothetical protein EQK42_16500 [Streptomyces albidoflavus]
MWLIDVLMAYGVAVDAVVSTAHVWVPLLVGAGSLGAGVRRAPPRGRHRRTRPDASRTTSRT